MNSIVTRHLEKTFGVQKFRVIKDISLEIEGGEFVSISGRSGSGKSTLLYLLSGLDTPSAGQVLADGHDFATMSVEEIHNFRNNQMGFVFQFHYLMPELTALENILMPARKTGIHEEKKQEAINLMQKFQVEHCVEKKPAEMSGGEQQRVAIARSMIMNPIYLFADEPTGNLDSKNGEIVMEIFEQINRERKTTILMVTHEPEFSKRAGREIFLKDGAVVESLD